MLLLIIGRHISQANPRADNQILDTKQKTPITLAQAKREAIKDTRLALQGFQNLVKQTFVNFTSNAFDVPGNYGTGVVKQDQRNRLQSEDLDWSALDELPECSNETIANNTMCIEKHPGQVNEIPNDGEMGDKTIRKEVNATKSRRRQRATRVLEVLSRQRRASENYKKLIANQPPKAKAALLRLPPRHQKRIEKLPPKRRERFFRRFARHYPPKNKRGKKGKKKSKKKKKRRKEKKIRWSLDSQVNANRMHGDWEQVKEQRRRISKYWRRYFKFDKYHHCNKEKEEWYRKPWKNLKLYFRVAGQHVRLPCNIWSVFSYSIFMQLILICICQ